MRRATGLAALCALALAAQTAMGNGGPFVIKYPGGDPAAKGVLARLDPSLKPARETRLRVIKEDLTITFAKDDFLPTERDAGAPPLARVTAAYTIENPTRDAVAVDFGFPILRGIYMNPLSMRMRPSVNVTLDGERVETTVISNSAIYGIIRREARQVIDAGVAADAKLAGLVGAVRDAGSRDAARKVLADYLTGRLGWGERDAALMVEFAGLDFGGSVPRPPDRSAGMMWIGGGQEMMKLLMENLGPLAAIGEQKATQFFARLASQFDPSAAAAYEAIFSAWGGDVRERSVDLDTGRLRPREYTVGKDVAKEARFDPTVYARVDYLDENAKISDEAKASCRRVLKNLPVVFTFAPMNLLHYRAAFAPGATSVLTVTYAQYAFADTRSPATYQLAYVVHPASLWDDFGPINLTVGVPEGVRLRASADCRPAGKGKVEHGSHGPYRPREQGEFALYRATLTDRTGELLVAVGKESWVTAMAPKSAVQKLVQAMKQAKGL